MIKDEFEKIKKEWSAKIMAAPGGENASELFLRRMEILEALVGDETGKLKKTVLSLREENEIIRSLIGASDVAIKEKIISLIEEARFLRDGITTLKKDFDESRAALESKMLEIEVAKRDASVKEDIHKKEMERFRELVTSAELRLKDIDEAWGKKYSASDGELKSQRKIFRNRLDLAAQDIWKFSCAVLDGWVLHVRDMLGAVFGATDYIGASVNEKASTVKKLKKEIEPDLKLIKEKTAATVGTFNKMSDFFSVVPDMKQTDINSIIRRMRENYSRLFGVAVKWPDEGEYPNVVCDENLVVEAIDEIIKNSLDALGGEDARSGSLEVLLHSDELFFTLDFFDSGAGIPEENIEKLFTPFFTTKPGRAGLGLVKAKRNILFHNGEIFFVRPTVADGKPSRGRFRIKLSHE